MATISVNTDGRCGVGQITVRVPAGASYLEAALASIERRTRLQVCGGPRLDHTSSTSICYVATLGTRIRNSRTYNVAGEVWIYLPRAEGAVL